MKMNYNIIKVTPGNIREHPQAICFINPKNKFFSKKVDWYCTEYEKGVRIDLLYPDGGNRAVGFIEYVPGESCWRGVSAAGYLFIHCIWTNGKKIQRQGLGSMLIGEVERQAKGMTGVAVMTSDNSFMVKKEIFLKNGYKVVSVLGKEQLMVKQFREGPLPSFKINPVHKDEGNRLRILYSRQCPWVARFIEEIKPLAGEISTETEIYEMTSADEAQNSPSPYGVFNLIYNDRVVADRYISATRFRNILKKEIKV